MIGEDAREELAQLGRLKLAAFVEATTLLLLVGVAVPLKHLAGWPLAVQFLGPIHGVAFIAYAWTVVQTVSGGGWARSEVARLVAGALVPFGGFLNAPLLAGKKAAYRAGRQV